MSKRKNVAGYVDSSDDDESLANEHKRSKSGAYAPPRVTAAPRPALGGFRLPGSTARLSCASALPSRHVSVSSTSSRPTLTRSALQSTRGTPEIPGDLLQSSSNSRAEPTDIQAKDINNSAVAPTQIPVHPSSGPSVASNSNTVRPTLAVERQLNELNDGFEKFKDTNEERHAATDSTLAQILAAIHRLESAATKPSRPPSPVPSGSLPSPNTRLYMSNPAPTPELIATTIRVVSGVRNRVGNKKSGAIQNGCKDHARGTLYNLTGMRAARDVKPWFEDQYGEPDTLPAAFINPDTGYCTPYPCWKATLVKQVAWLPTYILRFRVTVPNDGTELSQVLRDLSDEEILVLLNDGPFKTCCASWRDMDKSEAQVKAMQSAVRRYQRAERKATYRATRIREIPSLRAPEWEYLSHPKYMSQDESDYEGVVTTKRPEHRAQWTTNMYNAIGTSERTKSKFKHQSSPRKVEIVKCPIPLLEHGTGAAKATIRIPICGTSKAWRNNNPEEFQKYAHLINAKITRKPDIDSFLESHPASEDLDNGFSDDREAGDFETGLEDGSTAPGDGAVKSNDLEIFDYEGDEESGAILEIGNRMCEQSGLPYPDLGELPGAYNNDDIPIDPEILAQNIGDTDVHACTSNMHSTPPINNVPLANSNDSVAHNYSSGMPSPPLLELHSDKDPPDNIVLAPAKTVKSNKHVLTVPANDVAVGGGSAPKRRGRPPGSKNKPKPKPSK